MSEAAMSEAQLERKKLVEEIKALAKCDETTAEYKSTYDKLKDRKGEAAYLMGVYQVFPPTQKHSEGMDVGRYGSRYGSPRPSFDVSAISGIDRVDESALGGLVFDQGGREYPDDQFFSSPTRVEDSKVMMSAPSLAGSDMTGNRDGRMMQKILSEVEADQRSALLKERTDKADMSCICLNTPILIRGQQGRCLRGCPIEERVMENEVNGDDADQMTQGFDSGGSVISSTEMSTPGVGGEDAIKKYLVKVDGPGTGDPWEKVVLVSGTRRYSDK
ncbi:unnamed protein product, partial [Choristocarpus tenellus]